ncbi:MBL fold metallo-hydrolase [Actinoplanes oblitus]|uniref:MBL fold metallo-hydrolase n=1 Tax=Actinoplanes oblitus TaxID=3040509 RepID=UPI002E203FAB
MIIEPLVDRFYAWMHTVSPAAAALNLAKVQIPLLESYPRDPEMAALLASIRADRADMLAFADAITRAGALLRRSATGRELTHLYQQLPAALNGLVELAYDGGDQPALRLIEPLLYTSPYYDVSRQSIQLSLDTGEERPSVLGAPRLSRPGVLDLPIPFTHPGIDALFAARLAPTTLGDLCEALELDAARAGELGRLLTGEPALAPDRHIGEGGRIRYFGHACLVIQSAETTIVTDPLISTDGRHGDRYTLADLPDRIDLALITHGHPDHLVLETLLQLRTRIGAVVVPRSSRGSLCDPSIGLMLRALGFAVVEVDDFDEIPIPGGRVVATPFLGEHGDLDVRAKSTYFVRIAGAGLYIGADSSGIDPVVYRHVRSRLDRVDMAFLGMECDGAPLGRLYRGVLTDPATEQTSASRTLSRSSAKQAVAVMTELGADEGYIYAMGDEVWQRHLMAATPAEDPYQAAQIEEFLGWCFGSGITADRLRDKREWRW